MARYRLEGGEPERLFAQRLKLPAHTLYDEIGAPPEASADEIRAAKSDAVRRLQAEADALEKELRAVHAALPELEAAEKDAAAAEGGDETAAQEAYVRLAALQRQALALDPELPRKRERAEAARRNVERINRSGFDKPEQRLAYDRLHPPLGLLKLEPCAGTEFLEGRTLLVLLRRALATQLEAQGEPVFHPSDLTRSRFEADFTPHPLLDEEDDDD